MPYETGANRPPPQAIRALFILKRRKKRNGGGEFLEKRGLLWLAVQDISRPFQANFKTIHKGIERP